MWRVDDFHEHIDGCLSTRQLLMHNQSFALVRLYTICFWFDTQCIELTSASVRQDLLHLFAPSPIYQIIR